MAIDWNAFYANGGYSNDNSDPASYDDGQDENGEYDNGWKDDEQYEHDYDYSDM